jgi:GrpB-like predicted nucleotidyltransferase (UPF0157 family)
MPERYELTTSWKGVFGAVLEGVRVPFTMERDRSLTVVGGAALLGLAVTNPIASVAAFGAAAYVAWTRRELISAMVRLNRLPHPRIDFEPWTPRWIEEVAREGRRIEVALSGAPSVRSKVIHFGSTSIPNISIAKPIHDIAVALSTDCLAEDLRTALESLDYFVVGPAPHAPTGGDVWAIWLPKDDAERAERGAGFSLHLVGPSGMGRLRDMLSHARFLRAHPDEVRAYGDAKRRASAGMAADAKNYRAYYEGKIAFLMAQSARARAWAAAGNDAGEGEV